MTEPCRLLSIPRSTFYYQPRGETAESLALMRRIDEQFLETPFYGVRQMTWHLRAEDQRVNPKRIRRLMRLMGLMPIYQRPKTSVPAKQHRIWPYFLQGRTITEPGEVWCADITYVPMARGFLYLVTIMDWASRKVLAWRLSNTMEADFCVEALDEALARYGPPGIMNTDQGRQFTAWAWTSRLQKAGVRISVDGKGRYLDNIFVERLWRSLKYLAIMQVRVRLPARLVRRQGSPGRHRRLGPLLQPQAPPRRPRRTHPGPCLPPPGRSG